MTRLDVAVNRPDIALDPLGVVGVYIEDGVAKVATSEVVTTPPTPADWVYDKSIDRALDVSIAYDGSWLKLPDGEVRFVTEGEPWIFIVDTTGKLYAIQGTEGSIVDLCSDSVISIDVLRGWRDPNVLERDQGLVVAYVKSDGNAYYRSLCFQPDGTKIWQDEIMLLEGPLVNIRLFRTNDFRMGFIVSDGENLTLHVTERTWAAMSVQPETIDISAYDASLSLTRVNYKNAYGDRDNIALGITTNVYSKYAGSDYRFTSASNTDGINVIANVSHPLSSLDISDFTLVDSANRTFSAASITLATANTNTNGPIVYQITFEDFNNAKGDVTLNFKGTGTTRGENGQTVTAFNIKFTPVGLVPTNTIPPALVSITNVEG